MSMQFFYEDGQGNLALRDKTEEEDNEVVQIKQLKNEEKKVVKSTSRKNNKYTEMDKYRLIVLILEKLLKAAQAGRQLGIQEQKSKRETKKLNDIHKEHIVSYIYDHPTAVIDQVMESLVKQFEDLDIKKTAVHKFMKEEC
ncbi:hypothetical protein BJ944DRAFT_233545 [Cunninghamella echinulata]|nr:hypothetical protein BJ944DRAFT_233545 [Cunninghamella echinulata]